MDPPQHTKKKTKWDIIDEYDPVNKNKYNDQVKEDDFYYEFLKNNGNLLRLADRWDEEEDEDVRFDGLVVERKVLQAETCAVVYSMLNGLAKKHELRSCAWGENGDTELTKSSRFFFFAEQRYLDSCILCSYSEHKYTPQQSEHTKAKSARVVPITCEPVMLYLDAIASMYTKEPLVCVQWGSVNADLVPHFDEPDYDGFGKDIVVFTLTGEATLLVCDQEAASPWRVKKERLSGGDVYVLRDYARNSCTHSIVLNKNKGPRAYVVLRCGLHTKDECAQLWNQFQG
jgi:hypothetical protein